MGSRGKEDENTNLITSTEGNERNHGLNIRTFLPGGEAVEDFQQCLEKNKGQD